MVSLSEVSAGSTTVPSGSSVRANSRSAPSATRTSPTASAASSFSTRTIWWIRRSAPPPGSSSTISWSNSHAVLAPCTNSKSSGCCAIGSPSRSNACHGAAAPACIAFWRASSGWPGAVSSSASVARLRTTSWRSAAVWAVRQVCAVESASQAGTSTAGCAPASVIAVSRCDASRAWAGCSSARVKVLRAAATSPVEACASATVNARSGQRGVFCSNCRNNGRSSASMPSVSARSNTSQSFGCTRAACPAASTASSFRPKANSTLARSSARSARPPTSPCLVSPCCSVGSSPWRSLTCRSICHASAGLPASRTLATRSIWASWCHGSRSSTRSSTAAEAVRCASSEAAASTLTNAAAGPLANCRASRVRAGPCGSSIARARSASAWGQVASQGTATSSGWVGCSTSRSNTSALPASASARSSRFTPGRASIHARTSRSRSSFGPCRAAVSTASRPCTHRRSPRGARTRTSRLPPWPPSNCARSKYTPGSRAGSR